MAIVVVAIYSLQPYSDFFLIRTIHMSCINANKSILLTSLLFLAIGFVPFSRAQTVVQTVAQTVVQSTAPTANVRTTTSPVPPSAVPQYTSVTRSRDGIGKIFMGREIAHVMGHQAADWLDRPERYREERPDLLLYELEIKPGMSVADVGAGTGYHVERVSPLVGSTGRVYAVDIQPEMLALLDKRLKRIGVNNVVPVLGTIRDPKLAANSLDLIFMVDVYHEFDHPAQMLSKMVAALKPGGRLAFVEFRAEDDQVPIKALHKMSEAQIRKEAGAFGLTWVKTGASLPWQHVVIFQKP